MRKIKGNLIFTVIFFSLITTVYYWQGLGIWTIPAMTVLFLAFVTLFVLFIRQTIAAVKERYSNRSRLILISIMALVIIATMYKPGGLIDFEKLEGPDVLTADIKGAANCRTILKLKANHKFNMWSMCFGIDKISGNYAIKQDTIWFTTSSSLRSHKPFYTYGLLKPSVFKTKNIIYDLHLFWDKNNSDSRLLVVSNTELNKKFCDQLLSNAKP